MTPPTDELFETQGPVLDSRRGIGNAHRLTIVNLCYPCYDNMYIIFESDKCREAHTAVVTPIA